MIVSCELRPGEVLSEAVLSANLDIGRTPVRQAIDRLMSDGLVEVMPRKGSIVKPISLDEIFNVIEVRLINEAFCVRVAAEGADTVTVGQLKRNLDVMQAAAKADDVAISMTLDQEFHALIANATRNPIMVDLLRNLHDRSARFWFISLRAREHRLRVCDEHAAIVEGIARGEPSAAERAMRTHIESFRSNVAREV